MRLRGVVVIIAAVPVWAFLTHFVIEARKSPFGYELGSVAYSFPPLFKALRVVALLLTVAGLAFLAIDLVQWTRRKSGANKSDA